MHCTACGAEVPAGAKFCGQCGAPSAAQAKEIPAAGAARNDQLKGCAALLAIAGLIYAVAQCAGGSSNSSTNVADTQAVEDPQALAAKAKTCDEALSGLAGTGLIRDRPSANRIDVEEGRWAVLAAKEKRLLAAAVRCSYLRGRESDKLKDYAVVYGYRSGKRLAMATQAGVTIEGAD